MLGYDIYAYGGMVGDKTRTDAYAEALRRAITPETVVLDLGTGIGVLALLAAKAGARRVYAVDPNDAIQIGREMAQANGFADKIVFIQDLSTRIDLPERANVIVSDMHGIVPMFEHGLPSLIDARRRHLAAAGKLIPAKDLLWATPVEAPKSRDHVALPWANRPYGFDWTPASRIAHNDWFKIKDKPDPSNFFADPQRWATVDYSTIDTPNVHGELKLKANRAGECHGVVVWFDSQLSDEVGFSNAPGAPETIFGQAFFPFLEPVQLSVEDTIEFDLRCDAIDNYHLWRWSTQVQDASGKVKAEFKQSTFFGMPISAIRLRQHGIGDQSPKLGPDGEIRRFILSLMDGHNSLEAIAAQTATRFADRFTRPAEATPLVLELAEKYAN